MQEITPEYTATPKLPRERLLLILAYSRALHVINVDPSEGNPCRIDFVQN